MTKKCCTCKTTKSVTEFGKDNSAKDKLCPRCKICECTRSKKVYHKLSPEKKLAKKLKVYNLTREGYATLCNAQNGLCALCSRPFGEGTPYIDHCHKTGKVRGLLHISCNSIIGHAKDEIALLEMSINYLRQHENTACALPG
jgi:hypothetical protein